MEIKDVSGMAIMAVMLGILVSVGMVMMTSLRTNIADQISVVNESHLYGTNFTVTLGNTDLVSFTSIINSTNHTAVASTASYSVNLVSGVVTMTANESTACKTTDTCMFNYIYRSYNGSASTAVTDTMSSIAPVTTTWLSLIITVMVLSLIMFFVIKGFGGMQGGRE